MIGLDEAPRQIRETARSHALFVAYRDMGPAERSLARVARDFGRSLDAIEQLSRRHGWVARAAASDAENERVKRATQVRELEASARRQILAGQLFQSRGVKRVQALADMGIAQLSISEAMRLVEVGFRLERLGHGEQFDIGPLTGRQDTIVANALTPIVEIVRRDPSRVGPVVTLISRLRDLLPELSGSEMPPDLDDSDEKSELSSGGWTPSA